MNNPSTLLQLRTDLEKGLVDVDKDDEYLRVLQKAGQPPFSTTLLVSINQYIHKPEESIEERFKLDLSEQLKDVEADTRNRITLHVIENKGVIIDEEYLYEVVVLTSILFESLNPSHDIIEDYLKSLADTAKRASNVPSQDSGVGYFLCDSLIQCYLYSVSKNGTNKIASIEKKFMMMHKTGMLERVLRHIHLPWTITNDNGILADDNIKERVRFFFLTVASSTFSLSKVFKAGSPSRDALVDVLQGRIKPCAENEHMIEILEALKKFLDMGLTSGNPDDKYIS